MAKYKAKFEINERVQDKDTYFSGIVTAVCFYSSGEISYCVEKLLYNTDAQPYTQWISETRLISCETVGGI